MPATDYQGSPFTSIGRSILRRDQVHAMDNHPDLRDNELESFQRHVADLFAALAASASSSSDEILSLSWIRKLLDSFLLIQEEFRAILVNNRAVLLSRPPLDRLVTDFFERTVKALDVCNAIRDGIDQVRQWRNHLEIVVTALDPDQKTIGEGQIRRAKKALTDLTILMLDEKESGSVVAHRNRSFGRPKEHHHRASGSGGAAGSGGHFRSLSWSVSRSWSAARQLQAIGANLGPPRGNEIVATAGMAIPIYTMNTVLLFVMWALVAAIPCQDRGLQIHLSVPRSFLWAGSVLSLHEKVLEESKKRDRKNANGLLKEIHLIEKCTRQLIELTDNSQAPVVEEKESEFRVGVRALKEVCDALKDGLDPLERQVREVFHRIVKSRTEGLDCLSQTLE